MTSPIQNKTAKAFWGKAHYALVLTLAFSVACSFKAKRLNRDESDEKALGITDEWVMRDTENTVAKIFKQIDKHKGFRRYLKNLKRPPKIFIADVQNRTSEPYFPVEDLNDELLNEFSASGDYVLVDEGARKKIIKEIKYQNNGMLAPDQAKTIGQQVGADLMIFGAIRMNPKSRNGETIKEYSVNIRMTDISQGVEVLRTRTKVNKHSNKSSVGW